MMGRWWILLCGIALGGAVTWWALHGGMPGGAGRTPLVVANDEAAHGDAGGAVRDEDDGDEDGDDDDDDIPARVISADGRHVVVLDAAEREIAGIEVAVPTHGRVTRELHIVGTLADGAALVAAQQALAASRAQRDAAAATVATLRERLERLRALNVEAALGAARELADLEIAWRREQERVLALANDSERLATQLRATWGDDLVAASAGEPALALADGRLALVEFVLPASIATPPDVLAVAADGRRETARAARLVGAAPRVAPATVGRGWWALAEADGWSRGARVDLWLAQADGQDGVVIPASAVVWHGGRRWYFAALDDGRFERRAVPPVAGLDDELVLPAAAAATPVVVRGAQVLLAEEFRGAIPDEDED